MSDFTTTYRTDANATLEEPRTEGLADVGKPTLPGSADAPEVTRPTTRSRRIAIANQKGGVGKTTTAVNLSAALARQGRRTLLIDVDPQANASSGVGFSKGTPGPSSYDLLTGADLDEVIRATEIPNLDLIASSPALAGAE